MQNVACLDGSYTDLDADGVGDFCEENLAVAFAPEMRTWSQDNTAGEPYWAGEAGPNQTIRIVYLLAYYRDEGSPSSLCNLPFAHWSCDGHNGDSEAVMVELKYVASTQHWVLERAWLSQHGDIVQYNGAGTTSSPHGIVVRLQYPNKPQGYLRVWASQGKHSNYATQPECDTGGAFSTDTCDQADTSWRVFVSDAYDLGTRANPFVDCVPSRDPAYQYYGAGRVECFWTPPPSFPMFEKFAGWIPDAVGGARSTHYSSVLDDFGF